MTLNYIVPPAKITTRVIGDENSGTVEIEIKSGLTAGEVDTYEELIIQEESVYYKIAVLADEVASREFVKVKDAETGEETTRQMTRTEARGIILACLSSSNLDPEQTEYSLKYVEQLNNLSNYMAMANKRSMMAAVTSLIIHRLDQPKWTIEETKRSIKEKLKKDIYDIFLAEQALDNADKTATIPTDEDLGKSPETNTNPTEPTGQQSITILQPLTPDTSEEKPST